MILVLHGGQSIVKRGKEKLGNPQKSYMDNISSVIGLSYEAIFETAKDRKS